ncbi:MAG TPA: hypothetical protein VFM18_17375 [Methanosarcina sp.]|nr:hypothetical protein [Methanosarcina sp.]
MKKAKQITQRNFVLKAMKNRSYSAGAHQPKTGQHASRARQKQNYLRDQGKDD